MRVFVTGALFGLAANLVGSASERPHFAERSPSGALRPVVWRGNQGNMKFSP